MAYFSLKQRAKSYNILKSYSGKNPYFMILKRDIIINGNTDSLNDFTIEYILKNHDKSPIEINKTVKIADWLGKKKKEDWNIDFVPQKLKIISLLGETDAVYNCYIKYRQSVPPVMAFLPKKGVLTNFLSKDYHELSVDFNKYDNITTAKDPNRKLKDHQKEAVQFLLSRKKCILALDMGLGKSTALTVAAIEGNYDSVLIICPASIKTTLKRELMWYINENDISIIEGFNTKNKAELEAMLGYEIGKSNKKVPELKEEAKNKGKWRDNKFVIVNFDILDEFYEIPKGRSIASINEAYNNSPMLQYIKNKKSLIIIDEAHKLSNNTSNRFKIIKDLIKRGNPNSIFLSTGTPITNRPMNLYNLLSLIENNITRDWKYYVERYCNGFKVPAKGEKEKWTNIFLKRKNKLYVTQLTPAEKDDLRIFIWNNAKLLWVNNGSSNLDELKERVSDIYLRRVKEDIPGMVNKTIHEIFYDLTYAQKQEYEKLWDEYEAAQINENENKVLNKDLLEGTLYRKYISNIMVPYTIDFVDDIIENGEKIIIATCYDEELYALRDYYKGKCVIYNGKMSPKEKDKAENEFMNNDNIKVFIGNIQAAGVGLTLTSASKLIFNNISFVPGDNWQVCDRIHRISQSKDVDIYVQIFRDTQYEKMWEIVMKKDAIINQIIKKEEDK